MQSIILVDEVCTKYRFYYKWVGYFDPRLYGPNYLYQDLEQPNQIQ